MKIKIVRESLVDNNHPKVITAMDRYSSNEEEMKKEIIEPGYYYIYEPDYGGMRESNEGHIRVTEPISEWDLALQIAEKMNYISWYPWIGIRKFDKGKTARLKKGEIKINGTFPQKQMKIDF